MDVKYFDGIVPPHIDKTIQKFCQKLNYNKKPIYIDVKPISNSKPSNCFINVKNIINEKGGSQVNGWAIWLHPYSMIEAEAHSIYKDIDGYLIDVTPHKNNLSKILFLPDERIKYKGIQINNIRQNISKSHLIDECIKYWDEIFILMNKSENKYKHGEIILSGKDAERINDLNDFIQVNLINFYSNLKLKPNDICICGSGKKYIDCCKHKICRE